MFTSILVFISSDSKQEPIRALFVVDICPSAIKHDVLFLNWPFLYHLTINLGYQPSNDVGLDFFFFKKRIKLFNSHLGYCKCRPHFNHTTLQITWDWYLHWVPDRYCIVLQINKLFTFQMTLLFRVLNINSLHVLYILLINRSKPMLWSYVHLLARPLKQEGSVVSLFLNVSFYFLLYPSYTVHITEFYSSLKYFLTLDRHIPVNFEGNLWYHLT